MYVCTRVCIYIKFNLENYLIKNTNTHTHTHILPPKHEKSSVDLGNPFCCTDFEHINRTQIFTGRATEMCQRISAADPKHLSAVSAAKTKVIKLYTNKRNREVCPVNKEEDPNSLRRTMSFFMLMAQCFALCPVQGITGLTAQHLRYVRLVIIGPTVLCYTDCESLR